MTTKVNEQQAPATERAGDRRPPVPNVSLADMERMAKAIANSGLFGVRTPDQALALMLIAQAEGHHPALAARDYDIIQNRPAKKSEAMQRDFIVGGGKIEWHRLDDEAVEATFSHPQGGSAKIGWDLERARRAGLGGKDMWKKYPRQMLRSRVLSEGIRTVYPYATDGFYAAEEVGDMEPAVAAPVQSPPPDRAQPDRERWAEAEVQTFAAAIAEDVTGMADAESLQALWRSHADDLRDIGLVDKAAQQRIIGYFSARKAELQQAAPDGEPEPPTRAPGGTAQQRSASPAASAPENSQSRPSAAPAGGKARPAAARRPYRLRDENGDVVDADCATVREWLSTARGVTMELRTAVEIDDFLRHNKAEMERMDREAPDGDTRALAEFRGVMNRALESALKHGAAPTGRAEAPV